MSKLFECEALPADLANCIDLINMLVDTAKADLVKLQSRITHMHKNKASLNKFKLNVEAADAAALFDETLPA